MLLNDTRASAGRQLEQRRILLNKITCFVGKNVQCAFVSFH